MNNKQTTEEECEDNEDGITGLDIQLQGYYSYLDSFKTCSDCGWTSTRIIQDKCEPCLRKKIILEIFERELADYKKLNWFQKLFAIKPDIC